MLIRISQHRSVAVLAAVFCIAVAAGVVQRWGYIGTMTEGHHQWLMGDYVKWLEYWARDGIFTDRFLMLESPYSIETTTFQQRVVYTSFPTGGLVQVYVLHVLLPWVPLVTLISLHGVAVQALVALLYGLFVLWMMRPADRGGLALYFPIAAMLTYLFHPAPYYFHPMTPLAFQAAMVPVAVATMLEYGLRIDDARRRLLAAWQVVALGWLAACDWTFITLGLSLSLFRVLSPLPGQYDRGHVRGFIASMLQIWLVPSLVIAAYLANLYFNGALEELIERALLRTGVAEKGTGALPLTFSFVYRRVFNETLGNTQVWLHAGALASLVFFLRNRRDPVAVACCVAALTPYLYVALLPNDISTHDFQSLKFFVPLALVSFGIIPYRLIWALRGYWRYGALALMVFLWAFYLIHFRTDWRDWYVNAPPATQKLAEWLRANATFDEVYVSDSLEIADNPPVPLAISYKRVWLQKTPGALSAFVAKLPADAKLRFVSKNDYGRCFDGAAAAALPGGDRLYRVGALTSAQSDCLAANWPRR